MSFLKTLFSKEEPAADAESVSQEKSAFDAANAALDRAIAERQAAEMAAERRTNEPNRRKGGPDIRPPGSHERRMSPQPSFGRRYTPE